MVTQVPVTIIGCGPIGLAGALLLAQFGIRSLILERRNEVNTHPRSRFVDTNTMELMRLLGIEREIEETGLGPDWTEYNRWFNAVAKDEICAISSPTFHTVARSSSPTKPVMTCQDYVENVLLSKVKATDLIDVWYQSEVVGLVQDEEGTSTTVVNLETKEETVLRSEFTIGSDGAKSFTRTTIGSELHAEPRPIHMQDVIFEADLSSYVGDRKGGLLYCATPSGVLIFQPLNGVRRWRCQIALTEETELGQQETIARIREAAGAGEEAHISITSTGLWQPTPGCVDVMSKGRVFLAGDAAHISVPTGGMGNNIGFAGIRNLAWKIAYVMKGYASADILDTYAVEHRPIALKRIATGVQTTDYMAGIFQAYYSGGDVSPAAKLTQQYAEYDGVLLGCEIESSLVAKNSTQAPAVENEVMDFVPCIRAGRRAPHIWIDEKNHQSILDWFGQDYVLIVGSMGGLDECTAVVNKISSEGFPIRVESLPRCAGAPYSGNERVLVRPDGVIADCWRIEDDKPQVLEARIRNMLPR